jgi:hypothetical protein
MYYIFMNHIFWRRIYFSNVGVPAKKKKKNTYSRYCACHESRLVVVSKIDILKERGWVSAHAARQKHTHFSPLHCDMREHIIFLHHYTNQTYTYSLYWYSSCILNVFGSVKSFYLRKPWPNTLQSTLIRMLYCTL